jgi:hypothetical protein
MLPATVVTVQLFESGVAVVLLLLLAVGMGQGVGEGEREGVAPTLREGEGNAAGAHASILTR